MVRIPEEWVSAIDDQSEKRNVPPATLLRDLVGEILNEKGYALSGVGSITRGSRTDMKTPSGRAKALENLTLARASRKRVGRRKKEDASPAVARRLTPREEMELLVRTSLPEIQKILEEMRAQSARARRSDSSAA